MENQKTDMRCEIMPCDCIHTVQDRMYGKGMRVHNKMRKAGKLIGYRCTVCGKEKKI